MKKLLLFFCSIIGCMQGSAQFTVNAPITLTSGAQITVVNVDINTTANISGNGSVLLKNTMNTNLNCNNNELPSLIIDCNAGNAVSISSNAIIN
jgi:hypothetical protein